MKGEPMQNIDKTETTATPRRRTMWIGLGVVIVLAASVGLWFGLRNSSRPKPRQHLQMASMADMPSPANDDSVDSTTPDAALQVDLGPDDLKKAQIQTVHVDMRETGSPPTMTLPPLDSRRARDLIRRDHGSARDHADVVGHHRRLRQRLAHLP